MHYIAKSSSDINCTASLDKSIICLAACAHAFFFNSHALIIIYNLYSKACGEEEQCLRGLLDIDSVPPPPTSELEYFPSIPFVTDDKPKRPVRQVIIPQLQFNCHGVITSWSALTTTINIEDLLNIIQLQIVFVVWRPRGRGIYEQVGHNRLIFTGHDVLQDIFGIDNSTNLFNDTSYFRFNNRPPGPMNDYISFQPGDVLGWSIDQVSITTRFLDLVYREVNDGGQQTFDIFSTFSSQMTCSTSECDVNVTRRSSVIPYLSVQYSKSLL